MIKIETWEMFQRILAILIIIFVLPILVLASIAIKMSSAGPVLYRQRRHGINGTVFELYKFRSMYIGSDPLRQAIRDDNRVTRVGKFIRRYSIDELPQLFNVVKGDMLLVGPRPHPTWFQDKYGPVVRGYSDRHVVKPGITGLAQISGARGETDTWGKMRRRVTYDLFYIHNRTVFFDVCILATSLSVIFSNDAY